LIIFTSLSRFIRTTYTSLSISSVYFAIGDTADCSEQLQQQPDGFEECADTAFDDDVQCILTVGDYKGTVAQGISANKVADALVFAHIESTCDRCFKMSVSPYLKVVRLN